MVRAHQLKALRSAAPPWWYFLGFGVTLVMSSFAREAGIAAWAVVLISLLSTFAGMFLLLIMLHRVKRVNVVVRGWQPRVWLVLWGLSCALLSASGYLLAETASWPYPATIASATFAALFAASGPAVMRRIYVSTIA